ncbi:hypothetical protein K525DRAFT_275198 [Schizophyllum commune Loenen D]|nr:hypothetical protein K525DRAFT_275198 [Schizophyllum commune Loenen D]
MLDALRALDKTSEALGRPASALAPRASRLRSAPPTLPPSPCSLVFVARLGVAADAPAPQRAAHLARLAGGYAGPPSAPALRRLRTRPLCRRVHRVPRLYHLRPQ